MRSFTFTVVALLAATGSAYEEVTKSSSTKSSTKSSTSSKTATTSTIPYTSFLPTLMPLSTGAGCGALATGVSLSCATPTIHPTGVVTALVVPSGTGPTGRPACYTTISSRQYGCYTVTKPAGTAGTAGTAASSSTSAASTSTQSIEWYMARALKPRATERASI